MIRILKYYLVLIILLKVIYLIIIIGCLIVDLYFYKRYFIFFCILTVYLDFYPFKVIIY